MSDTYDAYKDFYDLEYSASEEAVDFVAAWAGDGPALEVGCGSGRMLLPLGARGLEVWGLDLSEAMLALARAKVAQAEPEVRERIHLVAGDMRAFDLSPQSFSLVYLPYNEFMHLHDLEDQLAALRCFRRQLRPGGILLLTCVDLSAAAAAGVGPVIQRRWDFDFASPDGPVAVSSTVCYEPVSQLSRQERYYDRYVDGRLQERRKVELHVRWFTAAELEALLPRAGFRVEGLQAGWSGGPYWQPGEMLVVARAVPAAERLQELQRELDDVRRWVG